MWFLTSVLGGWGLCLVGVVLVSSRHSRCALFLVTSTPCCCSQILALTLRLATPLDLPVMPQPVKQVHSLLFRLTGFSLLIMIKTPIGEITKHFLLKSSLLLASSSCLKCLRIKQTIRKYIK